MRVTNETKMNLKNGLVTMEMFGEAIYSYNKRAKNMRDKESEWRSFYRHNRYCHDEYDNVGKYKAKKEEYYTKKDDCLKFAQPTALHIVERERTCREWNDFMDEWDYDTYTFYEYYLFYAIGEFSFHSPITKEDYEKMKETLPTEELFDFETYGKDIDELMSVQTADKILKGLKNGEYKLIAV
jgi:hypothetical protein